MSWRKRRRSALKRRRSALVSYYASKRRRARLVASSRVSRPIWPAEPAGVRRALPGRSDRTKPPPPRRQPKERQPAQLDGDDIDSSIGLPTGAEWARPLVALDRRWTWFESRLLFYVLMVLTLVLCFWFSTKGMSEAKEAEEAAGWFFRGLLGASVLGGLSPLITRKLWQGKLAPEQLDKRTTWLATGAIALGFALASFWRPVGIEYFEGMRAWIGQGSSIVLLGELEGFATRCTILVALLGASIAASKGTHISIDVVIRFIPKRFRMPVTVVSSLATMLICMIAAWGFVDFIAVTKYEAKHQDAMGQKLSHVSEKVDTQLFVLRKQLELDLKAVPHVLAGRKWDDDRMDGRAWNEMLDDGGFAEHYSPEQLKALRAEQATIDTPRAPKVVVPDGFDHKMLIPLLDFIFPIGFFMMGLRILLRVLLVIGGQISLQEANDGEDEPVAGGATRSASA